jgi:hypothetical protein
VADFTSQRRFCLWKRMSAHVQGLYALAAVWRGKQEAEPGVALPDTFPSRAALVAIGYSTKEDLVGADVAELVEYVNISQREAEAVLAAFAKL